MVPFCFGIWGLFTLFIILTFCVNAFLYIITIGRTFTIRREREHSLGILKAFLSNIRQGMKRRMTTERLTGI